MHVSIGLNFQGIGTNKLDCGLYCSSMRFSGGRWCICSWVISLRTLFCECMCNKSKDLCVNCLKLMLCLCVVSWLSFCELVCFMLANVYWFPFSLVCVMSWICLVLLTESWIVNLVRIVFLFLLCVSVSQSYGLYACLC